MHAKQSMKLGKLRGSALLENVSAVRELPTAIGVGSGIKTR
jgi:hypothetical protein